MTQAFPHLAAPLKIGTMTLRNRFVMAPHSVTFLSGYGNLVDRIIEYHVERARGGVAMIVMSNFVSPASWRETGSWGGTLPLSPLGGLDVASDPALIPSYRKLADRLHQHGAKFVSQLNATGRQYWTPGTVSYGVPLWAPSALPCPKLKQIPKEMDESDIREFIQAFAQAATNMREAGADGVEVFAAQGYLLSAFLSPNSNQRQDQYGGSLENRMRFLIETLQAVRGAAGKDFAVGVRMNGDDFTEGGIDLPAACEIAARLQQSGLVDYLNVSGMTSLQYPGWIADISSPDALFADLSAAIKKAAPGLPVCVVSRIGSPEVAERVIASDQADMVGMARALISDPEFPNKTLRGEAEDIRRCTYSNQSCIMGHSQGRGVGCVHNVAVGKEALLGIGSLKPAAKKKKVVVVGGGPAGMAAARIAAERGHDVTLYERDRELGGQNRMTAMIDSRRGFGEVTRWLERQVRKQRVKLMLGTAATADMIAGCKPDAVIVATGSTPRRTGFSAQRPDVMTMPGVDLPHVRTVWDVFGDPGRIGDTVVLIDEDPHMAGVFVAEYLADQGKTVEVVTSQFHAGSGIHINFIPDVYRRLRRKGVTITPNTQVLAIKLDGLALADGFTGAERRSGKVDTVVLAMGNEACNDLPLMLDGKVPELHAIGDCVAPRRLDDAILDGERAGRMV
jgi:2,4-dienoyl-CoA reductase-like NADH-dependent reductase (Old Yellow Enzyme family)/thioredoxin reductase